MLNTSVAVVKPSVKLIILRYALSEMYLDEQTPVVEIYFFVDG